MNENLEQLKNEVEKEIEPIFEKIDKTCEINSRKVLEAFQKCDLHCWFGTTCNASYEYFRGYCFYFCKYSS